MKIFSFLKKTYLSWDKNDPWAKSAVIAYYALFSLPSLLIITMQLAGSFFGQDAVRGKITSEVGTLIGNSSAEAIEEMIASAALEGHSTLSTILGIGLLLFGATGVFFQLQKALNDIWSVRAKRNTLIAILKRRTLSFGLILAICLLMLISLVISALINSMSTYLARNYSETSVYLAEILDYIFSGIFITALIATIFTVLPDVKIRWKATLLGATVTTFLFLIGKYIIGFYFAKADPASIYGAAGSVVLIMLWVYYTCLILFFGAEFTVNWALHRNLKIVPASNATLSYEKELQKLREYRNKIESDKKKSEKLQKS